MRIIWKKSVNNFIFFLNVNEKKFNLHDINKINFEQHDLMFTKPVTLYEPYTCI